MNIHQLQIDLSNNNNHELYNQIKNVLESKNIGFNSKMIITINQTIINKKKYCNFDSMVDSYNDFSKYREIISSPTFLKWLNILENDNSLINFQKANQLLDNTSSLSINNIIDNFDQVYLNKQNLSLFMLFETFHLAYYLTRLELESILKYQYTFVLKSAQTYLIPNQIEFLEWEYDQMKSIKDTYTTDYNAHCQLLIFNNMNKTIYFYDPDIIDILDLSKISQLSNYIGYTFTYQNIKSIQEITDDNYCIFYCLCIMIILSNDMNSQLNYETIEKISIKTNPINYIKKWIKRHCCILYNV